MELDPTLCERARLARDARFDGRFYTGVRTTGIYCRPICPVRQPLSKNVEYFPSAAAAAEAGYRPCLRCRPESAPGSAAWAGSSAMLNRALRLISDGALDTGSVDELAARLGVGERHLRRLFVAHLGASPVAVAQTRRIHFAKKLVDETSLPLTTVAESSGFGSLRRFNSAFLHVYGRSPTELRRARSPVNGNSKQVRLRLTYRPPFDWDGLLRFLAARATPGVELVENGEYSRTVKTTESAGTLRVRRLEPLRALEAELDFIDPRSLGTIVERTRNLFDLAADPAAIDGQLSQDATLARSLHRFPGLRVPGAWDGFECAVRAVLGQQVSVRGATTLAGRLAAEFGEPVGDAGASLCRLFPTPLALSKANVRRIGMPEARAKTIRALAGAVADGSLSFDEDEDTLRAKLLAVPGIGPWTVEYVAMRALRNPDAFPSSDLGLIKALSNGQRVSQAALAARAEGWRPWRAYAAMHLWKGLE